MYVLQFYTETDSVTSTKFLPPYPPPPVQEPKHFRVEQHSLANWLNEQPNSIQVGVKFCRVTGEKKKNWKRPQFFAVVFSVPPSPSSLYSIGRM